MSGNSRLMQRSSSRLVMTRSDNQMTCLTEQMNLREFCLARKIQRMVRMIKEKHSENLIRGMNCILKSKESMCVRLICTLILMSCLSKTMYQSRDRVNYYRSHPTTVDVWIKEQDFVVFPSVSFCSFESRAIAEARQKYLPSDYEALLWRMMYLQDFIRYTTINLTTLWEMTNIWTDLLNVTVSPEVGPVELITSYEMSPYGKCINVHFDGKLRYLGAETKIEYNFSLHEKSIHEDTFIFGIQPPHAKNDPRSTFILSSGRHITYQLINKQYKFVNTPTNPCVSLKEQEACLYECVHRKYETLPCSFPFTPEVKKPMCQPGKKTADLFINLFRNHTYTNPIYDCGCRRVCDDYAYGFNRIELGNPTSTSMFRLTYLDNLAIICQEHLSYTLFDLLNDVGGNWALFVGLSMLDLLALPQTLLTLIVQCRKRRILIQLDNDPIFTKVQEIYAQEKQKKTLIFRATMNDRVLSNRFNKIFLMKKVFKIIYTGFCFTACFCLSLDKVNYFLDYPTTLVVSVKPSKLMSFPLITICGDSAMFDALRSDYAEQKNLPTSCNVTILDMIGQDNINLLWLTSSINEKILHVNFVTSWHKGEVFTKIPKEVALPDGLCVQYRTKPTKYVIPSAIQMIVSFNKAFCGRYYAKVYLTDPNEVFQLTAFQYLPLAGRATVLLQQRVFKRLPTPMKSCGDPKTANACLKKCLLAKVMQEINCSLPYMLVGRNVKVCSTSEEAKIAQSTFIKIHVATDPIADCGCEVKCTESMYNVMVQSEPREDTMATYLFAFLYDFVEYIEEVPAYNTITLACQIGGYLGLTIGLSIVTFLDGLISIISQKCRNALGT